MKGYFFFMLIILFLVNCEEEQTGFTIKGRVMMGGLPLVGPAVSADTRTSKTNTTGNFKIDNISQGVHKLVIKKDLMIEGFSEALFFEWKIDLEVNQNVSLKELNLYSPVVLHDAVDISGSSATIQWEPADATQFKAYKLYRHTEPEFDEHTATLVYSGFSTSDNSFRDKNLSSNTMYYYRVFTNTKLQPQDSW